MGNCLNINGSSVLVKLKEETLFGKTENVDFKSLYIKSNSIKYSQNSVESQLLIGGRSPSKPGKGNIEVSGNLEIGIDTIGTGFFIKNLLGNYSVSAAGSKYLHNFKISDSCLNSFQIEKGFIGSDINYKTIGLKSNELSIEFGGEGEVYGTVGVIGKDEYFDTIQVDSTNYSVSADILLNDTVVSLNDITGLEVEDVITFKILSGVTVSDALENTTKIELDAGSGDNFEIGDYINISNVTYMIKSIVGDIIYLNRGLESDILTGVNVYNVTNTNKIVEIGNNQITLYKAVTFAKTQGNVSIYTQSKNLENINGKVFENVDIEIKSVDNSVITGSVETLSFKFSNNQEGKRLIKDKGKFGKIMDGKVSLSCDLSVVFDVENARIIEQAKAGIEFDITLKLVNQDGDYFEIIMPKGTLTPVSPEVAGPSALSVSLTYSPFKTSTTEAIEINILNSVTTY